MSDSPGANERACDPQSAIDPELAAWNDLMYLAHPTPYGEGLAGRIERARVRAVLALARIQPSDAVLEIGCEAGRLLSSAPTAGRLVGIDISTRALRDADSRFAAQGREVELQQVDAQEGIPFATGEFDVVICSEMLEHVEHPERVLEHLSNMVTSSTRVVISVPIEAPKVRIKEILSRLGILNKLFPKIEPGQSEWHVHAFSGPMLRALTASKFVTVSSRSVLFAHHVALLRKR